jgi:hypothetical protein
MMEVRMTLDLGKATEVQKLRAAEIGILLAGLGRKKAAVQTERATAEIGWNARLSAIQAEEHKLGDELSDIGETVVSEK